MSASVRRGLLMTAGGGGGAKSVIFDFKDAWLSTARSGVRSIEFTLATIVITMNPTLSAAYATTDNGAGHIAANAFNTSLSKIDAAVTNSWTSAYIGPGDKNQRLICVFNTPTIFDGITTNNWHNNGGVTGQGMKNTKIYTSTDEITDTTYAAAISNSTLIYDNTIPEHVGLNQIDDQVLTLI